MRAFVIAFSCLVSTALFATAPVQVVSHPPAVNNVGNPAKTALAPNYVIGNVGAPARVAPVQNLPSIQAHPLPPDFLAQILETVKSLGGMSKFGQISAVIMLLISALKTSGASKVWDKLGEGQVWVAPALGLVAGILGLGTGGVALTPALLVTYVFAGGGAIFLHEILDSIKAMPGLGEAYIRAIEVAERVLGGDTPPTQPDIKV